MEEKDGMVLIDGLNGNLSTSQYACNKSWYCSHFINKNKEQGAGQQSVFREQTSSQQDLVEQTRWSSKASFNSETHLPQMQSLQ